MKLIIILIALIAGFITSSFDRLRQFGWFHDHINWVERQLADYGIWNSPIGVLLALFLPCLLLLLALHLLYDIWGLFGFVFSVFVLFVCLNREQLVDNLDDYIDASNENDRAGMEKAAALIMPDGDTRKPRAADLLGGFFVQSQVMVFSVLFWFVVLGPLGALIYRLSSLVYERQRDIHGGFSDSAKSLHHLLSWPVSRLMVLSYALVGHLVATIDTWREHEQWAVNLNESLITQCGLSALQYSETSETSLADWLQEARGLVNRSLVLWLAAIAFSTISGWVT